MESLISQKKNSPREANKTGDNLFDRIYKYYYNRKTIVALTADEEAIRERWDFAWKMLSNMYATRQVVEALGQKFGKNKDTCYDDLKKAMMLFGDPRLANKEAKRILSEDWIIMGIRKAWETNDLDAYERLIARFNKINRLEDDSALSELSDNLKNMVPHTIIITSDSNDLIKQARKIQADLVRDIEHEDVP